MPSMPFLNDTWKTIKEIDLRPHRHQAINGIRIALVGALGSGRNTLAGQMRRDPARPQMETDTPVLICDLDNAGQVANADLIILLVDASKTDIVQEKKLLQGWYSIGKKALAFINTIETPVMDQLVSPVILPAVDWGKLKWVRGSALDTAFLTGKFASEVISTVPNQLLGLGRYFPLFRVPIAHYLINDACFTNAAYALSTGLAEIIAVLDLPLTVTDMIVLSKNQAYLAYKLGLALGFSTRWQDYLVEFGSVLGSGFLWRQLARTLVGLIPVWGIIPKVAVSYAGTYVVGNVILQWYLTGRHVSRKQLQQLYVRAFAHGKNVAQSLISKVPRPRLPRRKPRQLPAPKRAPVCPDCGKTSAVDASFCQYCGKSFIQEIEIE